MGASLALGHRQHRVEQQYALICPALQRAMGRYRLAQIALDFLEDILQRGGRPHTRRHRETQAMGLPRPVVGVLADDHHLDPAQRRAVQRVEDQRPRRIDLLASGLLGQQELTQLLHVGLFELVTEGLLPVLGQLYRTAAHGLLHRRNRLRIAAHHTLATIHQQA